MGFLSRMRRKAGNLAKKGGRLGGKSLRLLNKTPLAKKLLKAVPVLGTAYSIYDIGKDVANIGGFGGGGGGMPALPNMGQLPAMAPTGPSGPGLLPRGPGGKLQMPWNDPSTPAALKQFVLDDSYLKVHYRAPKGYVVVKDPSGKPYPMLKKAAKYYKLWKAPKKPPISVGEYQALMKADRTVKKFKKIYTMTARVDKNTTRGGKVVVRKRK